MEFSSVLSALAALAAVLGLVVLAARLMRRFGFAAAQTPGGPRRMAMLETLSIDTRRRLTMLQCDGRTILVLSGGQQDTLLVLPGDTP